MAETTSKTPRKVASKPAKAEAAPAKQAPLKKAASKVAVKEVAAKSKPATVKKPVEEKPAAPRRAAEKKAPPAKKSAVISDEQRYCMIAEAAYYRAESCQFMSDPLRDWIEAERDIAILLSEA